MPPLRTIEIRASFAEPSEAEAAANALRETGVLPASLRLQHNMLPEARAREGRFVSRVLVIIVLWSIAGGVIGAGFGSLLAETIGPEGSAGLIVQLVSWIIVGHLIAGMLAGYFVLADRTQREMPPDRPVSVLTVRDLELSQARRIRRLLRSHDPLELLVSSLDAS
jgi:Zn-dependent protease with chaperone function